jgi:hypothetical protein
MYFEEDWDSFDLREAADQAPSDLSDDVLARINELPDAEVNLSGYFVNYEGEFGFEGREN